MNQEKLCAFCDPDRPESVGPFSFGEYSYATNGHILLRVPRLDDVPEWKALNERASVLFDGIDYAVMAAAMAEIPDFPIPEPEPCKGCKGTGKISECPECEGAGEVTLENDFSVYECSCDTCNGSGRVSGKEKPCHVCGGTGKEATTIKVRVGPVFLSSHYLTLLKPLPGIKIAPRTFPEATYFKWDGGDGLLMPMRA